MYFGIRSMRVVCALALSALAHAFSSPATAQDLMLKGNPNSLLEAMRHCLKAHHGNKLPHYCKYVAKDFVVIKPNSPHHLLVPTTTITGVEDPKLLPPKHPYWKYAWNEAKRYVPRHRPYQIGLAINSKHGRSQNQLHIHIACIKKTVSDALHHAKISSKWSHRIKLDNHYFYAIHVKSLDKPDPFQVVHQKVGAKMQDQTIVVTGASGGFYILDGRGHGEALLDKSCGTQPK